MKFGKYVELIIPEHFCFLDWLFISYSFQDKKFQRTETAFNQKSNFKEPQLFQKFDLHEIWQACRTHHFEHFAS